MVHQSEDDVRRQLVDRLGLEGGELAMGLRHEILLLVQTWDVYVALFGTNQERIHLFYAASGQVARLVERSLWDIVIVSIARLADPPAAMRRPDQKNLSIRRLLGHVPSNLRSEMQASVDQTLELVETKISIWRNKRIAHLDAAHFTEPSLLPPLARQEVTGAVTALRSCLKTFLRLVFGWEMMTRAYLSPVGDEIAFLDILNLGRFAASEREQEFRKLMESGRYRDAHSLYEDRPAWLTDRPERYSDEP